MKLKDVNYLFEMSNLLPKSTGLKYRIWYLYKTNREKHGPRIKVDIQGKDVSVSISDTPRQMNKLKVRIPDFRELQDWIKINKDLLLQYWESEGQTMDSGDVTPRIKKIP